jgi:uncharacterized membrane protein YphA (DoxX/SURF4 family)
MNRAAIVFLILLRFAIGWHFFMEGAQKLESVRVGETTTNRPFSSAAYFREAPGPGGTWARSVVGDPDAEAIALVTVEEPEGDSNTLPPHKAMPAALRKHWEQLLGEYVRAYKVSDEQKQEAQVKLDQAGDNVVLWLTAHSADDSTPEQTRKFASGEVKRQVPTAELIADYKARLADLQQTKDKKLWLFGKDVEKASLREKKAEVIARRNSLMAGLDKHTAAFMRSLNLIVAEPVLVPLERLDNELVTAEDLLKRTKDDKSKADVARPLQGLIKALKDTQESAKDLYPLRADKVGPQAVTPIDPKALGVALEARTKTLTEQSAKLKEEAKTDPELTKLLKSVAENAKELSDRAGTLPNVDAAPVASKSSKAMEWIDWLTRWGLTVIGLCLMVGLLSRTNAWLGALFLLMTYLAVPPWPWLPSVGPSEGNYLFVNKNLIEMLALCVLGVTATGRWFGFDAILHWIWTSIASEKKS